jgi:hypothetical protein
MKIHKKHEGKITLIVMVFCMTMVLTFVRTVKDVGMEPNFITEWVKSWGFSYVVALPTVMVIMPVIKRTISKFIEE